METTTQAARVYEYENYGEECVNNRKGNVVREFLSTCLGIDSHGISEVQSTIMCDHFEQDVLFIFYYLTFTDMNSYMFIN